MWVRGCVSRVQFWEVLREEVAPLKLHSTLNDMSAIVQQALHKRNASYRLEEDDDTTVFFTCSKDSAFRNTCCGALPCWVQSILLLCTFKTLHFRKLQFIFSCWLVHSELKWGVQKSEIVTIYNPSSFFVSSFLLPPLFRPWHNWDTLASLSQFIRSFLKIENHSFMFIAVFLFVGNNLQWNHF